MRKDDSTPVEAIDPDSLRPPSTDTGTRSPHAHRHTLLGFIFFMLVSVAGLVFWVLPEFVDQKRPPEPLSQESPAAITEPGGATGALAESPAEPSEQEKTALRLHAETLLLEIIEKQDALQQQGVKLWASHDYGEAIASGQAGDAHFRKQDFSEAIPQYKHTIDILQALQNRVESVLGEALEQGEQALTGNQGDVAKRHFDLARAIDPHNRQALDGLKRAETLGELFALLDKGGNLEAAKHLQAAEQFYQQAVTLDPLSGEAASALKRVTAQLSEKVFSRWMARAYALLQNRQFEDARAAFHKAQELVPDSSRPAQGLLRISQIVGEEKVASLKVEAVHFEKQEEWAQAAQSWQQLLALSPQAPYAKEGAARTQYRAALLAKLDHYLERRQRLYSADVSGEAQALLDEIASLNNTPGHRILQSAKTLQDVLTLARQPISIALHSDNQTEVTIFRVGRLGRFEHQDVRLRPGRYTIVGSRPGYRDVRKTLNVTPDMRNGRLSILCEETI